MLRRVRFEVESVSHAAVLRELSAREEQVALTAYPPQSHDWSDEVLERKKRPDGSEYVIGRRVLTFNGTDYADEFEDWEHKWGSESNVLMRGRSLTRELELAEALIEAQSVLEAVAGVKARLPEPLLSDVDSTRARLAVATATMRRVRISDGVSGDVRGVGNLVVLEGETVGMVARRAIEFLLGNPVPLGLFTLSTADEVFNPDCDMSFAAGDFSVVGVPAEGFLDGQVSYSQRTLNHGTAFASNAGSARTETFTVSSTAFSGGSAQ